MGCLKQVCGYQLIISVLFFYEYVIVYLVLVIFDGDQLFFIDSFEGFDIFGEGVDGVVCSLCNLQVVFVDVVVEIVSKYNFYWCLELGQ